LSTNIYLRTRRDPFADFDDAFRAIARRTFGPTPGPRRAAPSTAFRPAAELLRDGADAVVRLELPGLDAAQDLTVEVDRARLVVRGERRAETTDDHTRREVRYGSFQRTFALPEHVGPDAVSARYDAGVLTVRVAGAYPTPATTTRIAVSTGPADATEAVTDGPADDATATTDDASDASEQPSA
jgi:HSP20 family protein